MDDKRKHREEKRYIKQVGNQQRRRREKESLKRLVDGDVDFIPEFRFDKPTEYLNGYDKQ